MFGVRPPLDKPTAVPLTGASPARQCHFRHAAWSFSPAAANPGRHLATGVATADHPEPHLLAIRPGPFACPYPSSLMSTPVPYPFGGFGLR